MDPYTYWVQTAVKRKAIQIVHNDLRNLQGTVDLLICSSFQNDYTPTPDSVIGLLFNHFGISVQELSFHPVLSLNDSKVWVSELTGDWRVKQIACIGLRRSPWEGTPSSHELQQLFESVFFAVRLLCQRGSIIKTIVMPILGTGNQEIEISTSFNPLLTECISCLYQVQEVERILLVNSHFEICRKCVEHISGLDDMYGRKSVFISYSHKNQTIADLIAAGLEQNGLKPWLDHRMIRNSDYADAIVRGIRNADVFLFLVSRFSLKSKDCLRELRNAADLSDKGRLMIWPIIIEHQEYPPGYAYILTGLDYYDISQPPTEEKALKLYEKVMERI